MITFIHPTTGSERILRPTPFVSIASTPIRNKTGHLGSDYTITLTGTIVANRGSPNSSGGFLSPYTNVEESVSADNGNRAGVMVVKQNAIRQLFAHDGMEMRIDGEYAGGAGVLRANVSVESITFAEGNYVNTSNYTITLKATHLYDSAGNLFHDSRYNIFESTDGGTTFRDMSTGNISTVLAKFGGFVEDFTDEWSIEVDDTKGETLDGNPFGYTPRSYIITRNTSAVGRTVYADGEKREAWENARNFIITSLLGTDGNLPSQYPDFANKGSDSNGGKNQLSDIVLNLSNAYQGWNHTRTENINKTTGNVSITDRWVILKSAAYENYDISIESSSTDPFTTFNINGQIKGVSGRSAQDSLYGGSDKSGDEDEVPTPASNAITKYKTVTNDGLFDINSYVYKRVAANTNLAINPQPLSISVSRNDFTGEITYTVSYNTRPLNVISEASSENISIQDTYPGDVYSIVPVIGRPTGPVLQYIGGRTEYKRSINIDLTFDHSDIDRYVPNTITESNKATQLINTRNSLLMSKPTLVEPVRTQINNLVRSLSPLNEPNIRKCFVDAPSESWEPRTGRYSLSLSWTYELGETSSTAIEESS